MKPGWVQEEDGVDWAQKSVTLEHAAFIEQLSWQQLCHAECSCGHEIHQRTKFFVMIFWDGTLKIVNNEIDLATSLCKPSTSEIISRMKWMF